jgi:hypothetical protein
MKIFNDFSELVNGAAFLYNMSSKFAFVPSFRGYKFYYRTNEISHGVEIESSHVHVRANGQEVKFW